MGPDVFARVQCNVTACSDYPSVASPLHLRTISKEYGLALDALVKACSDVLIVSADGSRCLLGQRKGNLVAICARVRLYLPTYLPTLKQFTRNPTGGSLAAAHDLATPRLRRRLVM